VTFLLQQNKQGQQQIILQSSAKERSFALDYGEPMAVKGSVHLMNHLSTIDLAFISFPQMSLILVVKLRVF